MLACTFSLLAVVGDVWIVDQTGGPGSDFTILQAAVDAAVSGDVILIRPGFYSRFTSVGKGLTLVADGEPVSVSGSWFLKSQPWNGSIVEGVPTGEEFHLIGLDLDGAQPLTLEQSQGSIAVLDCTLTAYSQFAFFDPDFVCAGSALTADECDSVLLSRCELTGAEPVNDGLGGEPLCSGSSGLRADSSRLSVVSCVLSGGAGAGSSLFAGSPGASAIVAKDSELVTRTSTLVGGDGGSAVLSPGSGGACIALVGSTHDDFGSQCTPGDGGGAGTGSGGVGVFVDADAMSTSTLSPGNTFDLSGPGFVDAGQNAVLGLVPIPDTLSLLVASFETSFDFVPFASGVAAVGFEPFFVPIGVFADDTPQTLAFSTPVLPPAVPSFQFVAQGLALDALGGLELSNPIWLQLIAP